MPVDVEWAIAGEKLWRKFCPVIGCPELVDDPLYRTTVDRMSNRGTLIPKLQQAFMARTYEEWEALLLANDIPVGAINDIAQVVEHPQVKARESLLEVDHPKVGKVRVVRSPARLSKTPAKKPTPSPTRGQHTAEVLREMLGMDAAEIARLEASGVIGTGRAG